MKATTISLTQSPKQVSEVGYHDLQGGT